MTRTGKPAIFCLLLAAASVAQAQDTKPQPPPKPLAELAREADFVGLVQVADTDYQYVRKFPNGGTAYLNVLFTYKNPNPKEDLIQVYEEGLHPFECYFPDPGVGQEGQRYLVFLRFHPKLKDTYQGLPQGCALTVFVTDDNRYALRYPDDGMALTDSLQSLVSPMNFADQHAVVSDDDLEVPVRNEELANGMLVRQGDNFKYTHGITLEKIRKYIGDDALSASPKPAGRSPAATGESSY